jgi:hypothetical protein
MRQVCGILVAMMVVMAGAAEESDSAAMNIEQLIQAGNKYFKGPGANASTAKKEDFKKEIVASLKDKKISFAATVYDTVRDGDGFLMTLTDTFQTVKISATASTSDKKVLDIGGGDSVSVTGVISMIAFVLDRKGPHSSDPVIIMRVVKSEIVFLSSGQTDRQKKQNGR